jgi:methanogenic corrinoid protein MtbC1
MVVGGADRLCADDRHAFLECVLGPDEDAASLLVDELVRRGVSVEAVYLDLLAPTAVQLGELWDSDECDFLEVTIALGRLQRVLRELSGTFVAAGVPESVAGRALLSNIPGEQHTLGIFMVAEFMLRDGWGVRVGTPASSAELVTLVQDEWFDVVGFSAACDARLLKLRHEIASVRRHSQNPNIVVLVGGRVFVENPELVARVGADGYAESAADAPRCARALVERQPA